MRLWLTSFSIIFVLIVSVACGAPQAAPPTSLVGSATAVTLAGPTRLPVRPSTQPSLLPSVTPEPHATSTIQVIRPGTRQPTRHVQLAPTLPPTATPYAHYPTPQAAAAPFAVRSLERVPMDPVGSSLVDWSPDGRAILYAGYDNQQALYLFDTQSGRSTEVVHDASRLAPYIEAEDPLWPAWDAANDAIIYAQHTITSTAAIIAVDRTGKHLRTFATNVWVVNRAPIFDVYPSNPPGSLNFDASISANGRVGLLQDDHIVSMRLGEPDQTIPLAAQARRQLAQKAANDYHQLWLAPDGLHYALAVTRTLSLYAADQPEALSFVAFPPNLGRADVTFSPVVRTLSWAPNSQAVLYEVVDTSEGLGAWNGSRYVQRLTERQAHYLTQGARWPIPAGGASSPSDITWSPDSQWLVVRRGSVPQCHRCTNSQTIVDPFEPRATIMWAEEDAFASPAIWSPDSRSLAFISFMDTRSQHTFQQVAALHILKLERP